MLCLKTKTFNRNLNEKKLILMELRLVVFHWNGQEVVFLKGLTKKLSLPWSINHSQISGS